MGEALLTLGISTLLGYGVIIAAAILAMWALAKLPARLRSTMGYGRAHRR